MCAFMTFVQVTGVRFPKTSPYQWGAGLLSVMGVSFASVPLFTKVISAQMVRNEKKALQLAGPCHVRAGCVGHWMQSVQSCTNYIG